VTDVTLSPSTVYTNDTITATVTTEDADGDSVSVTYEWYVNGGLVGETGSTLDGATYFDKDEEVYVVVTPGDGSEEGDSLSSDSIFVSNSAPSSPEVSVEKVVAGCESGWTETPDESRCMRAYSGSATWDEALTACEDLDGTLVRIADSTEENFVAALVADESGSAEYWIGYNDIDSEGNFEWTDGETVTYSNWRSGEPNDSGGEDCTQVEAGSVWNDMPCTHTATAYVCQAEATAQDLLCTIDTESTDDDDDAISYTFEWDVNGLAHTGTTTTIETDDTIPDGEFFAGETWTCSVTPNDGDDDGDSASASYTINTAPEAPEISIDPEEPVAGADDLTCLVDLDSTDADGDDVTYTFEWEVDGEAYTDATTTNETGDTAPAEDTTADEEWTCTVTPNDGAEDGNSSETSVTVSGAESDCPAGYDLAFEVTDDDTNQITDDCAWLWDVLFSQGTHVSLEWWSTDGTTWGPSIWDLTDELSSIESAYASCDSGGTGSNYAMPSEDKLYFLTLVQYNDLLHITAYGDDPADGTDHYYGRISATYTEDDEIYAVGFSSWTDAWDSRYESGDGFRACVASP
jgi:hypothetical protein